MSIIGSPTPALCVLFAYQESVLVLEDNVLVQVRLTSFMSSDPVVDLTTMSSAHLVEEEAALEPKPAVAFHS